MDNFVPIIVALAVGFIMVIFLQYISIRELKNINKQISDNLKENKAIENNLSNIENRLTQVIGHFHFESVQEIKNVTSQIQSLRKDVKDVENALKETINLD